jgi:hypothetical protein
MFAIRAERADVAWTTVHETVADHLILSLEALAAFAARTAWDRAVVRSNRAVDIAVRTDRLLGWHIAVNELCSTYLSRYCV